MRAPPVKFIHSEKVTKLCEIFTLLLYYVVPVKLRFLKILWPSQNIRTLPSKSMGIPGNVSYCFELLVAHSFMNSKAITLSTLL